MIIGTYTNQQNEKLNLWVFKTKDNKWIYNFFKVGYTPKKTDGGYFDLNYLIDVKGRHRIKFNENYEKGGLKEKNDRQNKTTGIKKI